MKRIFLIFFVTLILMPFFSVADIENENRNYAYQIWQWYQGNLGINDVVTQGKTWKECVTTDSCSSPSHGFDLGTTMHTDYRIYSFGDQIWFSADCTNYGDMPGYVASFSTHIRSPDTGFYGSGEATWNYLAPGNHLTISQLLIANQLGIYTASISCSGVGFDGSKELSSFNNEANISWSIQPGADLIKTIPIGSKLSSVPDGFGPVLTDNDLDFLVDSGVTIDTLGHSNTYDFHDEIWFDDFTWPSFSVETGLSYSPNRKDEWGSRVFIPAGSGSFGYRFVFDEPLLPDNYLTDATEDEPIELQFLNRDLVIEGASSNGITVALGQEVFLNYGYSAMIEEKRVKLESVGNMSIVVSVDNVSASLTGGQTKTINGLRVKAVSIFDDSHSVENDAATLRVGSEIGRTYFDGDEFIGEDPVYPAWVWSLNDLDTANPKIGIKWNLNVDDVDETDNSQYLHPLYEGESYDLPWEHSRIYFAGLSQNNYTNYTLSVQTKDLYADVNSSVPEFSNVSVLEFTAHGPYGISIQKTPFPIIFGSDTIWLNIVGNDSLYVYYNDSTTGNAVKVSQKMICTPTGNCTEQELFYLSYGVSVRAMWHPISSDQIFGNLSFVIQNIDIINVQIRNAGPNAFTYLGQSNTDVLTANDITYYDGTSTIQIQGWEGDQRTKSAVIIKHPRQHEANDKFEMSVPRDSYYFGALIGIGGIH